MDKVLKIIAGLFKSKTFYFNVIVAALAYFEVALTPEVYTIVALIGNVILRFFTEKPLENK